MIGRGSDAQSAAPRGASHRIVGWREWVRLPQLGIPWIKAKVDTGARSSSLHGVHLERFRRRGRDWVRFEVHPLQRHARKTVTVEAPVLEDRRVRSSSGHSSLRPVIETEVELLGQCWRIEITIADRDEMGFRMLLGRQGLRKRVVVDPGLSYQGGKPPLDERRPPRTKAKRKRTKN